MTEIDLLWEQACTGDPLAFGDWMGRVERPVLHSLRRFARAVGGAVVPGVLAELDDQHARPPPLGLGKGPGRP